MMVAEDIIVVLDEPDLYVFENTRITEAVTTAKEMGRRLRLIEERRREAAIHTRRWDSPIT